MYIQQKSILRVAVGALYKSCLKTTSAPLTHEVLLKSKPGRNTATADDWNLSAHQVQVFDDRYSHGKNNESLIKEVFQSHTGGVKAVEAEARARLPPRPINRCSSDKRIGACKTPNEI